MAGAKSDREVSLNDNTLDRSSKSRSIRGSIAVRRPSQFQEDESETTLLPSGEQDVDSDEDCCNQSQLMEADFCNSLKRRNSKKKILEIQNNTRISRANASTSKGHTKTSNTYLCPPSQYAKLRLQLGLSTATSTKITNDMSTASNSLDLESDATNPRNVENNENLIPQKSK